MLSLRLICTPHMNRKRRRACRARILACREVRSRFAIENKNRDASGEPQVIISWSPRRTSLSIRAYQTYHRKTRKNCKNRNKRSRSVMSFGASHWGTPGEGSPRSNSPPDCLTSPPALMMTKCFAPCGGRPRAPPLDPASLSGKAGPKALIGNPEKSVKILKEGVTHEPCS